MGYLYYGNSTDAIEIPDHELAHVKVLASTKLRRSESFTLSWTKTDGSDGRSTVWLQASIPLRFELTRSDIAIDRRYLEELAQAASTSAGVFLDLAATAAPAKPSGPVAVTTDLRRAA